jgi:hypothetical protein
VETTESRQSDPVALTAAARDAWVGQLPARVFAPDPWVGATWRRAGFHILSAMERGVVRIGAVNYPHFWMRDGVIVQRALDLLGRHDLARSSVDYLAPRDFCGGFGAESDAPGEGIWAIATHARINRDGSWLAGVFHHVRRRVEILLEMLHTADPIYALSENRVPKYQHTPDVNLVCYPSDSGLINGRMDWHSPNFYINAWAACGLREAAWAARQVGEAEIADSWLSRARDLEACIAERLLPHFGNDRDSAVVPYPTGLFSDQREQLRVHFEKWFSANRLTRQNRRSAERLWTYFEAAQAHNALLLGMKHEAWTVIDGMLGPSDGWDLSIFGEGEPGGNEYLPFRNDCGANGWLDRETGLAGNMPHNWTSAEVVNLLRDVFAREEGGELVVGDLVPARWLKPGSRFGVEALPTDYGPITYVVEVPEHGLPNVTYSGPRNTRFAFEHTTGA